MIRERKQQRQFITDSGQRVTVPDHPWSHALADLLEHKRRKQAQERQTADRQASYLTEAQKTMVYLHRCNSMLAFSAQLRLNSPMLKSVPKIPTYAEFCTPKPDRETIKGERLPNAEHLSGYFEQYFEELLPYINKVEGYE